MKLKTRLVVFGASLSLTAIVLAAVLLSPLYHNAALAAEEATQTIPPETPAQDITAPAAGGYWVTAIGEWVEVFDGGKRDMLLETTDIALRSLRSADQELLKAGIWIADRETLLHFLEDFAP